MGSGWGRVHLSVSWVVPSIFDVNICNLIGMVWTPTDLPTAPSVAGVCNILGGNLDRGSCSAWLLLLISGLGSCSAWSWDVSALVCLRLGNCSAWVLATLHCSAWPRVVWSVVGVVWVGVGKVGWGCSAGLGVCSARDSVSISGDCSAWPRSAWVGVPDCNDVNMGKYRLLLGNSSHLGTAPIIVGDCIMVVAKLGQSGLLSLVQLSSSCVWSRVTSPGASCAGCGTS